MQCSKCGKEFSPLTCPSCKTVMSTDTCPACAEGGKVACPGCHQSFVVSRAPQAAPAPPPPPADAPAAPPPPPMGAQPPYGQPQGMPPQPPYGAPPPYPGQQQAIPTAKVPLGGWLMFYFVLNAIGLGYSVLSIVLSLTNGSFSVFTLGTNVVTSILPSAMILLYFIQRDMRFRPWYIFTAILSLLGAVFMLLGGLAVSAVDPNMVVQAINDPSMQMVLEQMPAESVALLTPDFIHQMMPIIGVVMIAGAVITAGFAVAWWVYFYKSKRVLYTFDPRNNPPR